MNEVFMVHMLDTMNKAFFEHIHVDIVVAFNVFFEGHALLHRKLNVVGVADDVELTLVLDHRRTVRVNSCSLNQTVFLENLPHLHFLTVLIVSCATYGVPHFHDFLDIWASSLEMNPRDSSEKSFFVLLICVLWTRVLEMQCYDFINFDPNDNSIANHNPSSLDTQHIHKWDLVVAAHHLRTLGVVVCEYVVSCEFFPSPRMFELTIMARILFKELIIILLVDI